MHSEQDSEEEGLETRDRRESPGHTEACTRDSRASSGHHASTAAANTPSELSTQEKGVLLPGADIQESREGGIPASLRYLKQLP